MTELSRALHDRADRAAIDPDLERLVDEAMAEGRHLVRRRRVVAAGASGAVVMGAVAALVAVLAPSAPRESTAPAGPRPVASVPVASVPASPAAPSPTTRLVAAPATPPSAPVSLRLVPDGWTLSRTSSAYASWTAPGAWERKYLQPLVGKLNVVVQSSNGKRLRTTNFPLRIAGHPASYERHGDGQVISLYVDPSISVDIDIPVTARLTRSQALQLADSVTIRNTTNPGHG